MAMEKFHFTRDGVDYAIPRITQVPMGIVYKVKDIEHAGFQTMTMLALLLGEESKEWQALMTMTGEEFNAFSQEWQKSTNLPTS